MKTSIKDQYYNEQQTFFLKIKKLLRNDAKDIQKLAMLQHAKALGKGQMPDKHGDKYLREHIKIITALATHIDDIQKGTMVMKRLGGSIAQEALRCGLSIKDAVNSTIFQKQAILNDLEASGILDEISARFFYHFCQTIESYYNILAAEIVLIYDHKLAEKNTRTKEWFRAIIEQSTDAIALVNSDGKLLYASPRTKSLLGYGVKEFFKLNNVFEIVPVDDHKQVMQLFYKLLKHPGSTEHVVYRLQHKNGKQPWIESTMTNLLDDPNIKAIVLNYHDISERKMLDTEKDDFISIATHELKTPVTSIKAYTQILQHRFEKVGNEEAAMMLKKMDIQLNKLTGLIRDLLDATRIDAGKLQFHRNYFDLNQLVSDIVGEMQLTTNDHAILKKLAHTVAVCGDRDRIGQVITNLLSNAIKYSPRDKNIIVTTLVNKKEATLRVRDFGKGIPKSKQDHVFERFYRISDVGDTFGGLGLGLYISSEIVRRHGGKIWVESSKGRGSVFSFTIPVKHHVHSENQLSVLREIYA